MSVTAAQSQFSETVDYAETRLCDETEWVTVSAGDTRPVETVADGIGVMEEYIAEKDGAVLVLADDEAEEVNIQPYMHRMCPDYRTYTYARLKTAEEWLQKEFGGGPIPATMLTLTAHQTDENGNPRTFEAVLDDLKEGYDKFRKVIDRATEGFKTEIVAIFEPHESGYPHLHVLIFGKADPTLQDKVTELWVEKYGVGGASAHESAVTVVTGRAAQIESPAAYLMKYIGKTMLRKNGERQHVTGYDAFMALLFVTGRRQWSVTAGLSAAMAEGGYDAEPEGNWRFVGVGYGLAPGRYSGETAIQIIKHIESERHVEPPGLAVEGDGKQLRL